MTKTNKHFCLKTKMKCKIAAKGNTVTNLRRLQHELRLPAGQELPGEHTVFQSTFSKPLQLKKK